MGQAIPSQSYENSLPPSDPDAGLIHAIARRDKRALADLYAKYASGLQAFLCAKLDDSALAEEIVQDVMLAVWQYAHQFEGRSSVKTWLLTIAHNRAVNAIRKKRLPIIQLSDAFDVPSSEPTATQTMEKVDMEARVQRAIQQLPAGYREVLTLTFYHQLSGQEIADVLDISLGTVKSRLFRAKEQLKQRLGQEEW